MPRSGVVLKYIPGPDLLEIPYDPNEMTIILHDGSELTAELCKRLQLHGHKLLVLTFPEEIMPVQSKTLTADIQEIHPKDATEESLRVTLKGVTDKIGQVICLFPQFKVSDGVYDIHYEKEKAWLKATFLLAKHLKQALNLDELGHRTAFLTVNRLDGAFGLHNPDIGSIFTSAISGLCKSLNMEWKKVFCRSLDIHPTVLASQASAMITDELYDADQSLTEAAYDVEGRRFALIAESVSNSAPKELQAKISRESVFLVTGGARGITAACVKQMAATFKSTFILLGRTKLRENEPEWADGVEDQTILKRKAMEAILAGGEKPHPRKVEQMVADILAQREIRETLAYIQAEGTKVYYRSVDVTNEQALKACISEVTAKTGKISGIIHGAGRLADKLIEHKTAADFDAVFDVKIKSLLALMRIIPASDLSHLMLFSSVAGFYGNVGQTDYAIANEALNRLAHLFRKKHPHVQVGAINWGAWDSGMVSPELKKILQAHDVSLVPGNEGPAAMMDQLSTNYGDQTQVILGGTLPLAKADISGPLRTYEVRRKLLEKMNPFLKDHRIQGNAVLPISMACGWMNQIAEGLYPGFHPFRGTDIKLFKGIVFNNLQQDDYFIKVQELEKSEDQVLVEINISSQSGDALPRPHYRCQIQLLSHLPHPPRVSLPDLQNIEAVVNDASTVYADGTLFHGESLRGITKILELSERSALLLCEHPGVSPEQQGQFPVKSVNAFLSDIMYQGMVIWVRRFHGCASLPLRTEWVLSYDTLPFGKPFFVELKILKHNDFSMEADTTAFDAVSGKVYMESHRAAVNISTELQWA